MWDVVQGPVTQTATVLSALPTAALQDTARTTRGQAGGGSSLTCVPNFPNFLSKFTDNVFLTNFTNIFILYIK